MIWDAAGPLGELHHIGICCTSLDREVRTLAMLGYRVVGETFEDPRQGVRGLFLEGGGGRLELVAALDPARPGVLADWLTRGAKMYHLAYMVADLPRTLAELRAARAKLVVEPVPATAFGGREIAFLMLPNMMLVELIQAA